MTIDFDLKYRKSTEFYSKAPHFRFFLSYFLKPIQNSVTIFKSSWIFIIFLGTCQRFDRSSLFLIQP